MKNSWIIWFLVVGVVITILVSFNYQEDEGTIPLSEIFPETEESYPVNIEYEFVDEEQNAASQQEKPQQVIVEQAEKTVEKIEKTAESVKETVKTEGALVKEQKLDSAAIPDIPIALAHYSIQVASFKTKERAEQKVKDLAEKQLKAFILTRDLKEKGVWYRVYIGTFKSRDEAQASLSSVQKVVSDSFIISLK